MFVDNITDALKDASKGGKWWVASTDMPFKCVLVGQIERGTTKTDNLNHQIYAPKEEGGKPRFAVLAWDGEAYRAWHFSSAVLVKLDRLNKSLKGGIGTVWIEVYRAGNGYEIRPLGNVNDEDVAKMGDAEQFELASKLDWLNGSTDFPV